MPTFHPVGALREFPEGRLRRRLVEGNEVAVVLWNGRFYAFSNRCPHAGFQMHFGFLEGEKLHCPIHYAEFDLETGKALYGPAGITDIAAYTVRVNHDTVEVSLTPPHSNPA